MSIQVFVFCTAKLLALGQHEYERSLLGALFENCSTSERVSRAGQATSCLLHLFLSAIFLRGGAFTVLNKNQHAHSSHKHATDPTVRSSSSSGRCRW